MNEQDLRDLQTLVNEADAGQTGAAQPGGPPPGADAPPLIDPVAEAESIFGLAVNVASVALPLIGERYGKAEVRRIAEAYVPVAAKRGWDLNVWLAQYALELALIYAVVAPVGQDLVQLARARMQAKKPKPAEPKAPAAPEQPVYKPMADAQAAT